MKSAGASSTFAKSSRMAAFNSWKLVAFFLGISALLLLLGGWSWYVNLVASIGLFFLLVTLLELWNARHLMSNPPAVGETPILPPTDGFEFLSDDEWGERFETRVLVRGVQRRILVPVKMFDSVLPEATELAAKCEEIVLKFEHFKEKEASSNPNYSDEIRRLEIGIMDFASVKMPNLIEVLFTQESGGEAWEAVWDQGSNEFIALKML
jgi:hypothetical protein